MPFWLSMLSLICNPIYQVWWWAGIFRFNLVKGTHLEVSLRAVMCELRPFMWPAWVVAKFASTVQYVHKPHTDWYDWPLHIFLILVDILCLSFYYFFKYKDDDDDDRWTKRRKKIAHSIKTRFTVRTPAHVRS